MEFKANRNRRITFRVLKQGHAIYSIKLYTLSKTAYVCYLLLRKTKCLTTKHKVTTYIKVSDRSRALPGTPNWMCPERVDYNWKWNIRIKAKAWPEERMWDTMWTHVTHHDPISASSNGKLIKRKRVKLGSWMGYLMALLGTRRSSKSTWIDLWFWRKTFAFALHCYYYPRLSSKEEALNNKAEGMTWPANISELISHQLSQCWNNGLVNVEAWR